MPLLPFVLITGGCGAGSISGFELTSNPNWASPHWSYGSSATDADTTVIAHSKLTAIDLPLSRLDGCLVIHSNPLLERVTLPNLVAVGTNATLDGPCLEIDNCPLLRELEIPLLSEVGGNGPEHARVSIHDNQLPCDGAVWRSIQQVTGAWYDRGVAGVCEIGTKVLLGNHTAATTTTTTTTTAAAGTLVPLALLLGPLTLVLLLAFSCVRPDEPIMPPALPKSPPKLLELLQQLPAPASPLLRTPPRSRAGIQCGRVFADDDNSKGRTTGGSSSLILPDSMSPEVKARRRKVLISSGGTEPVLLMQKKLISRCITY